MYSEKLAQIKQTVDQKTILAVLNANTENELRKLIQKYHIHIDVAEEAFSVLMLMCYGAISSSDCFNIINDMKVVKSEDFPSFITDININILKTIQEKIKHTVISTENSTQQLYDENLINPSDDEIKQSVVDAIDENVETAEEILARIEREANEEVDAEIRKRQEAQSQKEAELKKAEELRLAEEKRIEEEAGKEFDAMPAVNILDDEAEDGEDSGAQIEANKIQNTTNKQMAQAQNQITADLDLDMVPKTPVNTYIHTNNNLIDETTQNTSEVLNSEQTQTINIPVNDNSSLNFIESKAGGQIASTIDNKNNSSDKDLKNYMKDPYHEEI